MSLFAIDLGKVVMRRSSMTKRKTVEECLYLDTSFLKDKHYLIHDEVHTRIIRWKYKYSDKTPSIGVGISLRPNNEHIYPFYTINSNSRYQEKIHYLVNLESTPCFFGNKRWWFLCPMVKDGKPCRRRVAHLYSIGAHFACRHCLNLTYRTCQKSNNRVKKLSNQPRKIKKMLKSENLKEEALAWRANCQNIIQLYGEKLSRKQKRDYALL